MGVQVYEEQQGGTFESAGITADTAFFVETL
jgi:hypothetical protein